ncbi:FKBP-type peptidyl-prolyl cis-trans isomerase [Candidatus Micrarchaeota archaeon]|nr:FKBP-type peptidyl-prolyl cis-trans isomerase [Candidatus Micrarchaeota archaeon]
MNKPIFIATIGVLAVFLLFGCVNPFSNPTPTPSASPSQTPTPSIEHNVVQAGDLVTLDYTTWVDGKLLDSTNKTLNPSSNGPIQAVAGKGQLIRGFDQGLLGLKRFESANLTIPPSLAYGEYSQDKVKAVRTVEFATVFTASSVVVGNKIQNQSSGEFGTIITVNNTHTTIDFNPPLAGKTLVINVKILGIAKPRAPVDPSAKTNNTK